MRKLLITSFAALAALAGWASSPGAGQSVPAVIPGEGTLAPARGIAPDVLLNLDDDVDVVARLRLGVDRQRVIELRQMLRLELHVENGADDLNDFADVVNGGGCWHMGRWGVEAVRRRGYPCKAAAPPTISAISCVMCA